MQRQAGIIDFKAVAAYEKKLHHDVMAHIHAYGDQCPTAKSIIHLGATSAFVTDNGDLLQFQEALKLILSRFKRFLKNLVNLTERYASLPCLGYTHFQPAQLTTVGKRLALWLQDFLADFQEITDCLNHLRFLGMKGATGTQASLLALFEGDVSKVIRLEEGVAKRLGFSAVYTITGQTYPRKQDSRILHALANLGVSAHKCANDLRLLAHSGEMEEALEKQQVGSSAMPYKRNPILSERICSLSRLVINQESNAQYTAATQWLERSLDDSAGRRLYLPQTFLLADAILLLLERVFTHLEIHEEQINKKVLEHLPLFMTENLLMALVKKGGDRQQLHERLRQYSQMKQATSELVELLKSDPQFELTDGEWQELLQPKNYIGLAPQQVEQFLKEEVQPLLQNP